MMKQMQGQNQQELWRLLFPVKVSASYTNSITYLKHLTSIGVSIISYLRNIFPEESFTPYNFNGVHVRVLKESPKCQFANFLAKSLSNSFEALEKKYLHQLSLCFYANENQPETLIETYSFMFSYSDKSTSMNIVRETASGSQVLFKASEKQIEESTRALIRSCMIMTQGFNELPEKFDMSIRLYYTYDTPADYNPVGFHLDEKEDHLQRSASSSVKAGRVVTPFHKMQLNFYHKTLAAEAEEEKNKQIEDIRISQDLLDDEDMEDVPEQSTSIGNNLSLASEATTVNLREEDGSGTFDRTNIVIRCPCKLTDPINIFCSSSVVICSLCSTGQHSACFDMSKEQLDDLQEHYCDVCALEKGVKCSDENLVRLPSNAKEKLCQFRRILYWCTITKEISAARIVQNFSNSEEKAMKILTSLETQEVIAPLSPSAKNSLKTKRKIKHSNLPKIFMKHFKSIRLIPSTNPQSETDEDQAEEAMRAVTEGLRQILSPNSPQKVFNNMEQDYLSQKSYMSNKETASPRKKSPRVRNLTDIEAQKKATPIQRKKLPRGCNLNDTDDEADMSYEINTRGKKRTAAPPSNEGGKRARCGKSSKSIKKVKT